MATLQAPAYQRHFVKALEEPPGVMVSVRHAVSSHTQLVSVESQTWPGRATRRRLLLRRASAVDTELPRLPIKAPAPTLTFVPPPVEMDALQQVIPAAIPAQAPSSLTLDLHKYCVTQHLAQCVGPSQSR